MRNMAEYAIWLALADLLGLWAMSWPQNLFHALTRQNRIFLLLDLDAVYQFRFIINSIYYEKRIVDLCISVENWRLHHAWW